jgi:preprotein translocase subunit SecE
LIAPIKQQAKDLYSELERVDWPKRDKVLSATWTVIVVSVFVGLFLQAADLGLTWVMKFILPHS